MSASKKLIHHFFAGVVAHYHPFAEYQGYEERIDGFIVHYQGNGQQYMAIDSEGNILGDTTMGTIRTAELLEVGLKILDAML